ncbi:splicing regulatory glutamine/lysine-rich protein 1-like isoform X1 [Oxyura jamaicensis]|uniref:splicing regulatory glutamine/lysine-rich protein 1-like isoform X1 n=1 Tax=Oxyura jamaicensis TaxID=8884 RepID=UPI0015A719AF|nr:splicing regulatory glutamine/lysine-rich protein 1-like isoform X1 [Oxyura jamaicensis]
MQFLSLFLVVFADLEFLGPAEKDIKGRVEVLPNLLKHPKQQKESLHELLLQEETIKNIKRERDTNNERRERECSTSKKKSDKEKDRKEQSDQNTTTLKDKDHKDQNSETDKEVDNRDTQRTNEIKLQQNGNCQPNEESLSIKMEEV